MESAGPPPPQMAECPMSQELHECYHKAICDVCDFPILGIRFKCINCPDFDICSSCETQHISGKHVHPPNHIFVVLYRPLPEKEAWDGLFPLPCSFSEEAVAERLQVHRGVFCIRCKSPLCGVRYVCLNCVEMYTLCEKCEMLGPEENAKHYNGRNHVLAKIPFSPQMLHERSGSHFLSSSGGYGMIDMSVSSGQFSGSESADWFESGGMPVDPALLRTPDNANVAQEATHYAPMMSSGLQIPIVHSLVPDDPPFPLLPVVWKEEHNNIIINNNNNNNNSDLSRRQQTEEGKKNCPQDLKEWQLAIREMSEDDLDSVMCIEVESFSSPFDERYFTDVLRRGNYFLWVAEMTHVAEKEPKKVLGIFPGKKTKSETCFAGYLALRIRNEWMEVQSIAVGKRWRGYGIGRHLMERAIELGRIYACQRAKLHVSVWNKPAMTLYKSLGFQPVVWRANYYSNDQEDAIEMIANLNLNET